MIRINLAFSVDDRRRCRKEQETRAGRIKKFIINTTAVLSLLFASGRVISEEIKHSLPNKVSAVRQPVKKKPVVKRSKTTYIKKPKQRRDKTNRRNRER